MRVFAVSWEEVKIEVAQKVICRLVSHFIELHLLMPNSFLERNINKATVEEGGGGE